MSRKSIKRSMVLLMVGMIPVTANAAVTGTVDATITLEAGCIVNGQNFDDGSTGVDFGTIDFGTHNTLFTESDAQILSGATELTVQCSNGITPVVTFDAGLNDSQGAGVGLHAMAHQTDAAQFVTYNLYSDAGRTTIIPVGGDVTLDDDGTQQTVSVYARAFGEAGLITGTYTDTMTVVVTL